MRAIPHWMPWAEGGRSLSTYIMSIHHLDTFRYWLGDPARVLASTRPDPRTRFPHEDGINLYILEYDSGARASSLGRRLGRPGARGRAPTSRSAGGSRGRAGWPSARSAGPPGPSGPRARSTTRPSTTEATGTAPDGPKPGSPTPSPGPWPGSSARSRTTPSPTSPAATTSGPSPSARPCWPPAASTGWWRFEEFAGEGRSMSGEGTRGRPEPRRLMYHYTDRAGYNSIRAGVDWRFKASQPRPARSNHPFGAYFTPVGARDPGNKLAMLFVPTGKREFVFAFWDAGDLTPLRGGRGPLRSIRTADYVVEQAAGPEFTGEVRDRWRLGSIPRRRRSHDDRRGGHDLLCAAGSPVVEIILPARLGSSGPTPRSGTRMRRHVHAIDDPWVMIGATGARSS